MPKFVTVKVFCIFNSQWIHFFYINARVCHTIVFKLLNVFKVILLMSILKNW